MVATACSEHGFVQPIIEQPSAGVPPRQLVTESLQQRPVWFRNGDVIESLRADRRAVIQNTLKNNSTIIKKWFQNDPKSKNTTISLH